MSVQRSLWTHYRGLRKHSSLLQYVWVSKTYVSVWICFRSYKSLWTGYESLCSHLLWTFNSHVVSLGIRAGRFSKPYDFFWICFRSYKSLCTRRGGLCWHLFDYFLACHIFLACHTCSQCNEGLDACRMQMLGFFSYAWVSFRTYTSLLAYHLGLFWHMHQRCVTLTRAVTLAARNCWASLRMCSSLFRNICLFWHIM